MLFCVFFYNIIKVNHFFYCFIILLHLVFSFLHTRSLLVPDAYVSIESIESIDCIVLSSLAFNAILVTFSLNTSYFLLFLNLYRDFNINLLIFINFL